MTSLPISIPSGFSLLVKKGDTVKKGQLLAKASSMDTTSPNEQTIDLAEAMQIPATSVRKFLQKGPGDSVEVGDILATQLTTFGLKQEQVLSHKRGTIIRFERDTGKMTIRTGDQPKVEIIGTAADIISPLAGTITVCNNNAIVLETEELSPKEINSIETSIQGNTVQGSIGSGGDAIGSLQVLSPVKGETEITSAQIGKETIDTILLLPTIEKEAIAKAAAIGVAGILGTELSEDIFSYMESRKIDFPVIAIDPAIGKKLVKAHGKVIMHGKQKTIVIEE